MKTRVGFVSNSSSSSFLILGNRVSLDPQENEERWDISYRYEDETGLDCLPLNEDYEEFYVGKCIYNECGTSRDSIEGLENKISEAKEFLKEKGITEYQVFMGESNS